ncbi:uncharacterized protein LOC131174086 [Hevea brasiliensis]|uniref:uncharacterized protein LOC131174086 n=1 Tax=Hevea brasiliensis TaxID=3981 RepID=UPI0025E09446|nr:uncharacterized protein LOC131174086 [Hevea brasiliensis]
MTSRNIFACNWLEYNRGRVGRDKRTEYRPFKQFINLNYLGLMQLDLDSNLLGNYAQMKSGNQLCKNCNQIGHAFAYCPTIECIYCHGYGHILEHCPTCPPRPKGGHSKFKNVLKPGSSSVTAVAATEGSTAITMSDLEALFKQVQDPQTGQILGEGRRVGRLFELASLHLP